MSIVEANVIFEHLSLRIRFHFLSSKILHTHFCWFTSQIAQMTRGFIWVFHMDDKDSV